MLPHFESLCEHASLPALFCHPLFDNSMVNLFKQAWYGGHDSWTNLAKVVPNLIKRRGVINGNAAITEDIKTGALKNVRKRKDRQRNVCRADWQTTIDREHIRHEVVMR